MRSSVDGGRSRRRWVGVVVSAALALTVTACGGSGSGSKKVADTNGPPSVKSLRGSSITVTSWGGVWTQDEQKYLYGPFTKATGIKVSVVVNGSDPAVPAILQEQQHKVSIDIAEALNPVLITGKGYAQTFPNWLLSTFKKTLRPGGYTSQSFNAGETASVIACNPAVMHKCPTTPAQFFDVKDYPGPRAIVDDPDEAMPMALEATGVSGKKLFPLDISAALKELKMIKPHISVWPSSGSQQQQVLIDKQVGAEIMWNGRAYVVQQQNIPGLKISWDGALLPEPNGYNLLKGAPNTAGALEFLKWLAEHPQNQADWSKALTYPMPAKNLDSLLPKAVAAALPINKPNIAILSNKWFAAHETQMEQTWQGFLG